MRSLPPEPQGKPKNTGMDRPIPSPAYPLEPASPALQTDSLPSYEGSPLKHKILPFAATWMQLEIIIVSKKDKYVTTYTYNLKYDTNEFIYETENRHVVSKGEGTIGRLGLAGANITYRMDKQVLCTTQGPVFNVINHSGKEYLKDEYITESLLYSRV